MIYRHLYLIAINTKITIYYVGVFTRNTKKHRKYRKLLKKYRKPKKKVKTSENVGNPTENVGNPSIDIMMIKKIDVLKKKTSINAHNVLK